VAPKPKKKRRWLIPVIALVVVAALLLGTFLIFGDQIKRLFGLPAPDPALRPHLRLTGSMLKKRCSLQMMLPWLGVLQSIVTQKLDQKNSAWKRPYRLT